MSNDAASDFMFWSRVAPMRRTLKRAALLLVALLIVLALPIGAAFFGRRSAQDGVEINGIRVVKDGIVTVGVVPVSDTTVALIDAGNDKSGAAIRAELSRRKLNVDSVVAILLTHGHPDHVAAIPLFPRAEVIALDREVAIVEGRESARGPLPRLFPVAATGVTVNHPVRDGETIPLGQTEARVFAVSGHTVGSAAYLVKGVLFLGDAADVGRSGDVQGAPWVFTDNQAQDRASLRALNDRLAADHVPVTALVFAHSGVLTDGLAPLTAFARKD
jgi:glyoxylase-like metal-dependent hydrolase (beta-lactamase superfamily II)